MGKVYRARDSRLDREVAIKLLPANYATDPDRLKRFGARVQFSFSRNGDGPVPSPDGTLVAYEATRDGTAGAWVARVDGSDEQRLTSSKRADVPTSWTPDSHLIARSLQLPVARRADMRRSQLYRLQVTTQSRSLSPGRLMRVAHSSLLTVIGWPMCPMSLDETKFTYVNTRNRQTVCRFRYLAALSRWGRRLAANSFSKTATNSLP